MLLQHMIHHLKLSLQLLLRRPSRIKQMKHKIRPFFTNTGVVVAMAIFPSCEEHQEAGDTDRAK